MYKLLIIDDEAIVRVGIRHLIPWETEGFEICGEGIDGRDGLQKVLKYNPDLVLVDIKMPGMSGIALINEAKSRGFCGEFIVLTGYAEFEFAKSAISLGVKEYLLKPIDENKLQEIVKQIYRELENKNHLNHFNLINNGKAKQEVLRRTLLNLGSREELDKEIELYQMNFNVASYCVAIVIDRDVLEHGEQFYNEKIQLLMRGLDTIETIVMDGRRVLINKGGLYKEFKEQLELSNKEVKKRYGTCFFITIGHNVSRLNDLYFSYECALYLVKYEFLYEREDVLSIDIIQQSEKAIIDIQPEYLCALIEIGDIEAINDEIKKIKTHCRSSLLKESEIKSQVLLNIFMIKNRLEKNYDKIKQEVMDYDDIFEKIENSYHLEDLIKSFEVFLQSMSRMVGQTNQDNVVKRMYAYMEKNYDKELKLETIAMLFNYNSAYLGKIFRKEIGENFNNSLDVIRINNAKQLLKQTNLKVYQVSQKVGYSNIDYFYLKFKKHVGISPKEFKGERGQEKSDKDKKI